MVHVMLKLASVMQCPRVGTAVYTGDAQIHRNMHITNLE